MADYDDTAFNHEQGSRARKLFAAVVLAALDDAIIEEKRTDGSVYKAMIEKEVADWAKLEKNEKILMSAGIDPNERIGKGIKDIADWARSRNGREVLTCAGIDPNERVVAGLVKFVHIGRRTSVALSREESDRQAKDGGTKSRQPKLGKGNDSEQARAA